MKLNFKKIGHGKPLIILHGLLGSLDNWTTLAKKFAENFTVYTIDQRNHGKSPHSKEFNYQLMVEDLNEFLEDNQISSANILGHSMGGKTAMYFAMKYSEKIEKLIIVDIAPVLYPASHKVIFETLLNIDLNSKKSRTEIDNDLSQFIPDFGIRQFLMKGLTRNKERKFIWKYNVKDIWKNYKNILMCFDENVEYIGETLFIKAEKSNYIKNTYYSKIKKNFPNSTIQVINDTGHWLHAEKPKEFYSMALNFIN